MKINRIFSMIIVLVLVATSASVTAVHAAPTDAPPEQAEILTCHGEGYCTDLGTNIIRISISQYTKSFSLSTAATLYFYGYNNMRFRHTSPWNTTINYKITQGYSTAIYQSGNVTNVPPNTNVDFVGYYSNSLYWSDVVGTEFIDVTVTKSPDVFHTLTDLGGSFIIISTSPINNCDLGFTTVEGDTFEIDPTIEDPLGPLGVPPDDQIYETLVGEYYELFVDEEWNDGTSDLSDFVISWDGDEWDTPSASCTKQNDEGVLRDVYYIQAESETFYIRADDEAGQFGDNSHTDAMDPFIYTIGLADAPCEVQFDYDTGADLVASVTVNGNDEDGELVSSALTPLEWYAITVTSGTWLDDGAGSPRTDMEFRVYGSKSFNEDADFHDLDAGETGVWCQSSDGATWYVQAQNVAMLLRVNNESGDFSTNTGALSVSVYHAVFTRQREACELDFDEFDTPVYDTVDGTASSGKEFIYAPDYLNPDPSSQLGHRDMDIVNGAYYILDTVDGPWSPVTGTASVQLGQKRYDMAVNDEGGDGEWVQMEDWDVPECNVALDAVGHRRVYFQVPIGGASWLLRVNDTETWSSNSGYMAWNLYKGISGPATADHGRNPWIFPCMADTQTASLIADHLWIPPKFETGTLLRPDTGLGWGFEDGDLLPGPLNISTFAIGDTYIVGISDGPWDDAEGNDDRFDAAISTDNGDTWTEVSDDTNPDIECSQPDQAGIYYYFRFTVQSDQIWRIRVNDSAGDFSDNGGNLSYRIWSISTTPIRPRSSGRPGNHPQDLRTGVCALSTFLPQFAPDLPDNWTPPTPSSITDFQTFAEFMVDLIVEPVTFMVAYGYGLMQGVGNYIGDWLDYASLSVRAYIAWCPENTDGILALLSTFKTREPIATLYELDQFVDEAILELESYDWDEEVTDTSIFTVDGRAGIQDWIDERFFPAGTTTQTAWEGGEVISFDNTELPSYFYECSTVFTGYIPSGLATGVCFVNAYARETGFNFYMQLLLDIALLFAAYVNLKLLVGEVVYMMTGVRPAWASPRTRGLWKALEGDNKSDTARRQTASDENIDLLRQQFAGRWRRNDDGSYSRR